MDLRYSISILLKTGSRTKVPPLSPSSHPKLVGVFVLLHNFLLNQTKYSVGRIVGFFLKKDLYLVFPTFSSSSTPSERPFISLSFLMGKICKSYIFFFPGDVCLKLSLSNNGQKTTGKENFAKKINELGTISKLNHHYE